MSFVRQYQNTQGQGANINQNVPNTTANFGFTTLCAPAFMKGTG